MELYVALIIYFVILFGSTLFFYKVLRKHFFASFVISLIMAMIVLIGIYPPSQGSLENMNSSTSIYFLILFGSFLLFFIYGIMSAVNDIQPNNYYFDS